MNMKRQNNKAVFNTGIIANFGEQTDSGLIKKALILAEGTHTDSKGRVHDFPRERVIRIGQNTNNILNSGGSIPFLTDHNKTVAGYAGNLDNMVQIRTITEDDVAQFDENNQKSVERLIGKLGIFTDGIKIKVNDIANKVEAGLKTISPGIDINKDVIREISLTPIPAIAGMSLFSKAQSQALTWDEIENEQKDMEEFREEFNAISEKFVELITRIYTANEWELQERDPQQLLQEAFITYIDKLSELLELNQDELDPNEQLELLQQQQQQLNSALQNSPMYQGQDQANGMGGVPGMYDPNQLQGLNFSLAETAYEMLPDDEFAEFWGGWNTLNTAWKMGRKNGIGSAVDHVARSANQFLSPIQKAQVSDIATKKVSNTGTKFRKFSPFKNPKTGKLRWGNIAGAGAIGAGGVYGGMKMMQPEQPKWYQRF